MTTLLYIDPVKIYRSFIPAIFVFLATIFFSIYFFYQDFFCAFSFFKVAGLAIYLYVMIRWAKELIFFLRVARQDKPIIQVSDDGLTFNYLHYVIFISWNQVIKIDQISLIGIILHLTQDTIILPYSFFAKMGPNTIAYIRYVKGNQEKIISLLLTHKDKFYQPDAQDL